MRSHLEIAIAILTSPTPRATWTHYDEILPFEDAQAVYRLLNVFSNRLGQLGL